MTMDARFGSMVPDKSIFSENNFCMLLSRDESICEGPNEDQDDFGCCILAELKKKKI